MNTALRTKPGFNMGRDVWYPDRLPSLATARMAVQGRSRRGKAFYLNDFSALNPTIWANEAILQLTPNLITSRLINRDFDTKVHKFGDLVNAFVPGTFEFNRKGALCDPIVVQDATGTTMQLPLDQWPQVSFQICDGEEDRSALDLVDTLLVPAVNALSIGIDRIVNSYGYQFLANTSGELGGLSKTTIEDYILEAAENMDIRGVPEAGRTFLMAPRTKRIALSTPNFQSADKIGSTDAIARARIEAAYGFDFFMTQSTPWIKDTQAKITAAVNNAAGYAAGATTVAFDGSAGGTVAAGQWAKIAGDNTPQHITAVAGGTSMTIAPGLKRAVADNAVITIVAPGAVNLVAGYAGTTTTPRVIGWAKEILTNGWTTAPQLGQLVSFGVQNDTYAIIKVRSLGGGGYGIMLDRPLKTAIANTNTVNLGPAGIYNFAMLRDAFVMVNRPLPTPRAGTGTVARVQNDTVNKISIRVLISYDSTIQAHVVTLDTLMGIGTLSLELGELVLG